MAQLKEKREWVECFFKETGASYDEVVKRFTFGVDHLWKKKMLSKIPPSKNILDLACGTGILTLAIKKKYPSCRVTGIDITEGYLEIARAKALSMGTEDITFINVPAEEYVSNDLFNVITTSYLPKYADIPRLIHNMSRMLAPGGIILFHDFTYPTSRFLQLLFGLYFKCAQPIGGWFYPEWKKVLKALPAVIRQTEWVSEVTWAMDKEGFFDIEVESLTLQGAAIVSGRK